MQIVILDGYTLNPGDLSWDRLEHFGEVVVYPRTPVGKVYERSKHADILLTNKVPLKAETLTRLSNLKLISVSATGYDVVDIETATNLGIKVCNVPTYGTDSVAQMVFALLLEFCHRVQNHGNAVVEGEWSASQDFCFWKHPLMELAGKTMGIIGLGRIGRRVAFLADAFGMQVLATGTSKANPPELKDFRWASVDEVLSESDVISLHCPLYPETKGLINHKTLGKMKSSAFLINTSRGGLVIEEDLAESLNHEIIAGAGLDVLSQEPPEIENPLFTAKNILITPHISWATKEARTRLINEAITNIESFINETPVNIVN